ncbi:MAG: aminodeoxychorismate/anthranilate synthase component II [Acidobacteriota bacterium]
MILMIDNYDSFTYNLVQLLTAAGAEVEVLRNDAEPAQGMLERKPDGIVLSPGPGRPEGAGVCLDLLAARPEVPLLGVCLGHQSLGLAFGAEVARAPCLMHGKTSRVRHDGEGIFEDLPNPFEATRYHSLDVPKATLPDCLVATAWSDDDILMAMRHRELPWESVQFHPESILTREGPRLLVNFLRRCGVAAADPPPLFAAGAEGREEVA